MRVLKQAQISQRVFNFRALEKAQAAVNAVRQAGIEQRCFHHPALRIAAVKQGDFLALAAFAHQLLDLVHKPLRLGKITGRFIHAHRLARAGFGAEVFAQAFGVVTDQCIGRIKDVAEAPVIALELDLLLNPELAHKVGHVAHASAAKGVNALVVVAHRHHRAARHRTRAFGRVIALPGQHFDPGVLQLVGVLELVDQDVAKAPLVMLAHGRVVS